jgi:hypothetical protein
VRDKESAVAEVGAVFTKADGLILAAAFLSFLFSVSLWFGVGMRASKEAGVFVGLWVPSILSAGNYLRQAARAKRDV